MIHLKINDEHQLYFLKYGKAPDELFINFDTREKLLGEIPELKINFASNTFGELYGKPVYVVHMDVAYLWIGSSELKEARKNDLDETYKDRTIQIYKSSLSTQINGSDTPKMQGGWVDITIPREVIEFNYPDQYPTN